VAMPASSDVNLSRAVVFVARDDDDGALGILINRPSPILLGELFKSLEMTWRGDPEARVFAGGPVGVNRGWLLYNTSDDANVVLTGDLERMRQFADAPPAHLRVMLGSIDWRVGQLGEAANGGVYTQVTRELVFETPPEEIWGRIQAIGIPAQISFTSWLRGKLGLSTIPKATLRRK